MIGTLNKPRQQTNGDDMSKFIRDNMGRLKGQVIENGNVTFLRDGQGQLKGTHVKSADKTYTEKGRYVGPGDQLLRTLDK